MLKRIKTYYGQSDKITKVLIKLYGIIIYGSFILMGINAAFYKDIFPDYTTAAYWMNEMLLFGVGMTKAFIIPIMFYEIMKMVFGTGEER